MAMIIIRVNDKEKEWLEYMAEFYEIALFNLMKKYSMEQLEDEYDKQIAEISHKRWLESSGETVSMSEILDKFGEL